MSWNKYWAKKESLDQTGKHAEFHHLKVSESLKAHNLIFGRAKVLDFGCGDGGLAPYLNQLGEKIYLYEISQGRLNSLRQFARGYENVYVIDRDELFSSDFKNKFDLVVLSSVIQYMDSLELERTLEQIRLLINKKGKVVLIDVPLKISRYREFLHMLMNSFRYGYFYDFFCMTLKRIFGVYRINYSGGGIYFYNQEEIFSLAKKMKMKSRREAENYAINKLRQTYVFEKLDICENQ